MKTAIPVRFSKIVITTGALAVLATRLAFPDLKIDAVALGLLVLAVLPWLSPLVKSAELPGGFKIEFQDVKNAAERVAAGEPAAAAQAPSSATELSYVQVAEQDPRLGLILLRIEIERRLRAIAERAEVSPKDSLSNIIRQLGARSVLSSETIGGLRELVDLGNRAAHGVPVAFDATYAAIDFGPKVLGLLDAKLASVP